ncbi:DUF2924 domain-containing protein [Mesorhizobium sp. KR9-304]|uniref:DUF2924 domain-containing protein n=1 Tax=Mesorhizobium sp. KR9-304 TaxID=3156614 RepID=UPI0032B5D85B
MTSLDERIEQEVAALGDLTREELAARWAKAYGCPPPKGVKRGLLERAAAWHLQTRHFGGLSPATRKAIRDAVKLGRGANPGTGHPSYAAGAAQTDRDTNTQRRVARRSLPVVPAQILRSGTRLVREWNGRTHVVDVSEDGFVFDGRTYGSLSAIAKRITGAHWSGPRFFGL